jgi:hypothetical protein
MFAGGEPMGFAKGTVVLSKSLDIPLLRCVYQAGHATARQVFHAMHFGPETVNKNGWDSFNRRVRLLVKREFLGATQVCSIDSRVLSLGPEGETTLRGIHYEIVERNLRAGRNDKRDQIRHDVELFEMYLQLRAHPAVASWRFEPEIRADNNFTTYGYVKDYDAIVGFKREADVAKVALEYERTPKTISQYERIAGFLARERRVEAVIYAVTNVQMESFLSHGFRNAAHRVFITDARSFATAPESAAYVDARSQRRLRLSDVVGAPQK